jgi:hypothetical protein
MGVVVSHVLEGGNKKTAKDGDGEGETIEVSS